VLTLKKIEAMSLTSCLLLLAMPRSAYAMHIMEGFLPFKWAVVWYAISLPFVFVGFVMMNKKVKENHRFKMLLAFAGAFTFVLSALKIPSVTGSCSHPTGAGLGAILFGPFAMGVIGLIVLLFQALLLAHGGITTLGANVFSMAVAGPVASYCLFRAIRKLGGPDWLAVFLASSVGDLVTYLTTSLQLALAFPAEVGGVASSFLKFASVFAITQVPLAASEGLLTVLVINILTKYSGDELIDLGVLDKGGKAV